ncbi:MAG: recombinase family protein [Candidatus Omnitrophota bacterium]|nr:recombinase family protein [Candidatus Omnitrophota bacterium]
MKTDIAKKRLYCAIYTRKSTSEGLERDFTSLDNQRESSESYINSQKSEGWILLPDRYDDGGYTGANTERPALQKLIADIKEGRINCIVVYKVDRLSRSLLDFVKLLELFEKYNVVFVSVTQAFNTNNSMGRLTLNILLSFAQFEREIISERVKDKMGAARKKGKWLGGRTILGYDLDKVNHKLLINEKDAKIVCEIFDLYISEKSFLSVAKILNEKGYLTKRHATKSGDHGGIKFKNTNIHFIVKNVLYIGKVKYNGELYKGTHEAIISDETFNKAQEIIANNRVRRDHSENTHNTGLLSRILRCKACNGIMFHTYTSKKKDRKYRYYVCLNAHKRGYGNCPTKSVNAQHIENAVIESLIKIAGDSELRKGALEEVNKHIREEIEAHDKKTKVLIKDARNLHDKIDNLKETLKTPTENKRELEQELKTLTAKYGEYDRLLTEARLKEMSLGQKIITDRELEQALIVNSPIWETFFPQEKHKVLKLMLKEVDYSGTDAKIGLTLNHGGLKFLYLLLHPELQKDLKPFDRLRASS